MPRLTIDNRQVEVDNGATVLDAAAKLGIEIPTMCFLKGYEPSTSCMVCVVKVNGSDSLVPACGTHAEDGMKVESDLEEVHQARKAALELLLSDHVGDCIGPCQTACPARMNIPLMIRQISAGRLRDAITTVKKDIALPAVLGRICPKPCERVCRRAVCDEPVSICLLKRYVADLDLQSAHPYLPPCKPSRDKRVAIIGAGPAGLAAAYYLQIDGYTCTIFDDHEKPGGMLRYAVSQDNLPTDVLEAEIALIEKLGMEFQGQTRIEPLWHGLPGRDAITGKMPVPLSIRDLRRDFDAVFVAIGKLEPGDAESMGLEAGPNGISINNRTYETNLPGVFAGGGAVRKRRLAVRAVADGKEAAVAIGQYLSSRPVTGPPIAFNTRIGKLKDGEIEMLVGGVAKADRGWHGHPLDFARDRPGRVFTGWKPVPLSGFTARQAGDEAARCMHCDCRKPQSCKLRQYARQYRAKPARYKGQRRSFVQQLQHPDVIYESGKCINCGLCIQIASHARESLGLTFIGRGFDVRVAVPFDHSIAEGLKHAAKQCVEACPTGALAFKNEA